MTTLGASLRSALLLRPEPIAPPKAVPLHGESERTSEVVLEQSPDGRWWISKDGWGRPVGLDFQTALLAAADYYPTAKCVLRD